MGLSCDGASGGHAGPRPGVEGLPQAELECNSTPPRSTRASSLNINNTNRRSETAKQQLEL